MSLPLAVDLRNYFRKHFFKIIQLLDHSCSLFPPPLKSQYVWPSLVQLDFRKERTFWAMSFTTLVEKVEFSRWGMSSVFIISYFWSKNQKQWENFPPWAPQHKLLMLTILVVLFIYLFIFTTRGISNSLKNYTHASEIWYKKWEGSLVLKPWAQ